MKKLELGDQVVYEVETDRMTVTPASYSIPVAIQGEHFRRKACEYCMIMSFITPETVELLSGRGVLHRVYVNDPHLHRPGLLERTIHGKQFPALDQPDRNPSIDEKPRVVKQAVEHPFAAAAPAQAA